MKYGQPKLCRLKELLDYDPGTGVFTRRIHRPGFRAGGVAGGQNQDGYIQITIDGIRYMAHRLAWLYVKGYSPEGDIDHIDRDSGNNRINNLREVSRQCNLRNTGNPKTNSSGVKGVGWFKPLNKWRAMVTVNGRCHHIGVYEDFDEAVFARLAAEQCLGWDGCDSHSPSLQHAKRILIGI